MVAITSSFGMIRWEMSTVAITVLDQKRQQQVDKA
jgi:hypothetical protein